MLTQSCGEIDVAILMPGIICSRDHYFLRPSVGTVLEEGMTSCQKRYGNKKHLAPDTVRVNIATLGVERVVVAARFGEGDGPSDLRECPSLQLRRHTVGSATLP